MSTSIIKVSSQAGLMSFIKFPWKIYSNNPYWVPPLIMDRKKFFNTSKNPFFKHAEMQLFLAKKNDEVVGRIAAIKNETDKVLSSEKLKRVADIAQKRSRLKISQLDMKNFEAELDKVKYVYNKAWAPNWGFVPMTEDEIDAMAKDLKSIIEPSLVLFGEIDGKLVGFALVLLDYNFIFKQMNGRLFPFGIIKLFTQKKKIPWSRIITLGIIPEYQKRRIYEIPI